MGLRLQRAARAAERRVREIGVHLAHIIPTRRCNLACIYCSEYDDFSSPVPIETLLLRVDRLAELGTSVVTASGGDEPLLHPD